MQSAVHLAGVRCQPAHWCGRLSWRAVQAASGSLHTPSGGSAQAPEQPQRQQQLHQPQVARQSPSDQQHPQHSQQQQHLQP